MTSVNRRTVMPFYYPVSPREKYEAAGMVQLFKIVLNSCTNLDACCLSRVNKKWHYFNYYCVRDLINRSVFTPFYYPDSRREEYEEAGMVQLFRSILVSKPKYAYAAHSLALVSKKWNRYTHKTLFSHDLWRQIFSHMGTPPPRDPVGELPLCLMAILDWKDIFKEMVVHEQSPLPLVTPRLRDSHELKYIIIQKESKINAEENPADEDYASYNLTCNAICCSWIFQVTISLKDNCKDLILHCFQRERK